MDETRLNTIEPIEQFLSGSVSIEFSAIGSYGSKAVTGVRSISGGGADCILGGGFSSITSGGIQRIVTRSASS